MKKKTVVSILFLNLLAVQQSPALAAETTMSKIGEVNLQNLFITNSCVQCDLENGDMTRRDLQGADLRGANLKNARFQLADLSGANLQGADLTGARLGGADLSGADLRGARYAEKGLDGAYLSGALLGELIAVSPQVPQNDKVTASAKTMSEKPKNKIHKVSEDDQPAVEKQSNGFDDIVEPEKAEVGAAKKTHAIEPVVVDNDLLVEDAAIETKSEIRQQNETDNGSVGSTPNSSETSPKKTALVDEVVIERPVENEIKENIASHPKNEKPAGTGNAVKEGALSHEVTVEEVKSADGLAIVVEPDVTVAPLAEPGKPEMMKNVLDEELVKRIKRNKGCYKCDFSFYDLRDSDFEGYDFEGTKFSGADLTGADLENCNLKNTDFSGALLINSDLRGADFYKANLTEANLAGARTEGVLMDGADLNGVKGYIQNLVELQ